MIACEAGFSLSQSAKKYLIEKDEKGIQESRETTERAASSVKARMRTMKMTILDEYTYSSSSELC